MKKVIFISSKGGHLSELLQLKSIFTQCEIHLVSEKDVTTQFLSKEFPNKVSYLKYGTKSNLLSYCFILPYNIYLSLRIFLKEKPDVIVTTGAHTCVPMCYIAHLFKKKIIYIETFANIHTKTMTGRLIYPIADCFIVQWESMLKLYPKAILGNWIY